MGSSQSMRKNETILKSRVKMLEKKLKAESKRNNFQKIRMKRAEQQIRHELEELKVRNKALEDTCEKRTPCCGICWRPYQNNEAMIPRILSCGHTLCESCGLKLAKSSYVECPFDRIKTPMFFNGIQSLPKNFTILQLANVSRQS
uniref:RING-type domain-containing protein n=1 Tax=Caenorhabditis japonica TaxID=281687 RepID=A0A8R1DL41_CAEJA